jgi:hypothetical protein
LWQGLLEVRSLLLLPQTTTTTTMMMMMKMVQRVVVQTLGVAEVVRKAAGKC